MEKTGCLNCGTALMPNQKFCPGCGQKTETPRLTFRSLFHDFSQAILHTEKGILNLVRGLATHPGKVIVEYVEGKRKRYFNPFSFLALCIAFMVLMNSWLKPYDQLPVPSPQVLARMPDEKTQTLYLLTIERQAVAQNFFNKNMNFGTLITAPFFAAFLWLFFRHSKRNMAEIIVAYIFLTGFNDILISIFVTPLMALFKNSSVSMPLYFTSLFLVSFYYAWGLKAFFKYKTAGGYMKVLLAFWLIGLIGLILVIVIYFILVYRGGGSVVLQYL